MIIDVVHTEDTDGHGGPQRRTFWGTAIIRNWTAISRTVTCPLSRLQQGLLRIPEKCRQSGKLWFIMEEGEC